ncbi:MAG: hypothetical protein FWC41_12060 [Firmicutes bacterium]|nr:hypothetical protein [Bacillota bacterium]
MKKLLLLLIVPFGLSFFLQAQITQYQADEIVIERMSNEAYTFNTYAIDNFPVERTSIITTSGEIIEIDYRCWVYFAHYLERKSHKYLIVKESNGNLLEINVRNDETPNNLDDWRYLFVPNSGIWEYVRFNGFVNDTITLFFNPKGMEVTVKTSYVSNPNLPYLFINDWKLIIIGNNLHWAIYLPDDDYPDFVRTMLSYSIMKLEYGGWGYVGGPYIKTYLFNRRTEY